MGVDTVVRSHCGFIYHTPTRVTTKAIIAYRCVCKMQSLDQKQLDNGRYRLCNVRHTIRRQLRNKNWLRITATESIGVENSEDDSHVRVIVSNEPNDKHPIVVTIAIQMHLIIVVVVCAVFNNRHGGNTCDIRKAYVELWCPVRAGYSEAVNGVCSEM